MLAVSSCSLPLSTQDVLRCVVIVAIGLQLQQTPPKKASHCKTCVNCSAGTTLDLIADVGSMSDDLGLFFFQISQEA